MSNFFRKHADTIAEDTSHRTTRSTTTPYTGRRRLDNAAAINIDCIEADPQHREHFDEESLDRLARSLAEHGQLQPIRVRWDEARDAYIIIAGERRWRAARKANLTTIDCVIVQDNLTPQDILREQIIENALREDLLPSETAQAFADLMANQNWNAKQVAEHLNVAPSTVSRTLAVLKLSPTLREQVDAGQLSIKDAIKQNKEQPDAPPSPPPKRRKRPSREHKLVVDGFTITVKARRILTDELVHDALAKAAAHFSQSLRDAA